MRTPSLPLLLLLFPLQRHGKPIEEHYRISPRQAGRIPLDPIRNTDEETMETRETLSEIRKDLSSFATRQSSKTGLHIAQ